ncbi:MAG TPA: type III pantothenate kinase [Ferrovibrio sp.]|uniref:type III pantothenate kinase n=1 Tax=Ferrovibrio sp. TaxID=1917215 RepID=UPI002ED440FC
MLLAINSGNTNVGFAVFDGDTLRGKWRISTNVHRTADEYAVWLTQLMALDGLTPAMIDGAIIGSVVPEALFSLKALVRRYFRCDLLVIGENGERLGIETTIDRPEEAGADRLVNSFAAHRIYGGPLIVVDFGTATTFDVIDGEGRYAGGVIAPGINLSLEALYMAAAKLPSVAIQQPPRIIGKTTVDCMQSGIFWGYVGLIEGLIARIRAEYGAETSAEGAMKVIATGGLAPLFYGATDVIERVDEDLTLRGLAMLYRANRDPKAP